jgi:hypothetical protein
MVRARRQGKRVRPDLRTISLNDPSRRILWDELKKTYDMSSLVGSFLDGFASHGITKEQRARFLRDLKRGIVQHYNREIEILQVRMQKELAEIDTLLEEAPLA